MSWRWGWRTCEPRASHLIAFADRLDERLGRFATWPRQCFSILQIAAASGWTPKNRRVAAGRGRDSVESTKPERLASPSLAVIQGGVKLTRATKSYAHRRTLRRSISDAAA